MTAVEHGPTDRLHHPGNQVLGLASTPCLGMGQLGRHGDGNSENDGGRDSGVFDLGVHLGCSGFAGVRGVRRRQL